MSKQVATFKYTDETGADLYRKNRYEWIDNGRIRKSFSFEHTKRDAQWRKGRFYPPVLYNLPVVIDSDTIFFVEGERKADLLNSWGLTATSLDSGARSKWYKEYNEFLRDKLIIILPDNDEPGREYALKIANNLNGVTKEIKIVDLPGLKESEDIIDWCSWDRGADEGNKEKLMEIIKNTAVWTAKQDSQTSQFTDSYNGKEVRKLNLLTVKDLKNSPSLEYIIEDILIKDTVTLLVAPPDTGKSILSNNIAFSITHQRLLFDHFEVKKIGTVVIIDEENPAPIIKERLEKLNFKEDCPLYYVHYNSLKIDNPSTFYELVSLLKPLNPVCIIIDSLIRFHNADEKDNSAMARVMAKFRELSISLNTTILVIHHTRKKGKDGDKKENARGASDIVGSVDASLFLERKEGNTLLLSPGKMRTKKFDSIVLRFNEENLRFEYVGFDQKKENGDTESEKILDMIIAVIQDKKMGYEAIRKGVKALGCKVGRDKLRGIIEKHVDGDILIKNKDEKARNKYLYSVDPNFLTSRYIYRSGNQEVRNEDSETSNNGKYADNSESKFSEQEVVI